MLVELLRVLERCEPTTAQPIKGHVDRFVAHNDQRALTSVPTFES